MTETPPDHPYATQLELLRQGAELTLRVARHAAEKVLADKPGPPDPSVAFTNAIREFRQLIALEVRIAGGEAVANRSVPGPAKQQAPTAPRQPSALRHDPRRAPLRQALHQAADVEPDRAERNALKRDIDQQLDHEFAEDPEAEIPVPELLTTLANRLGLRLDLSRLPDYLLGLAPLPTLNGAARYHRRE